MPAISRVENPTDSHALEEKEVSSHVPNKIAQVIAISSGKGGVGKSTLTTNLGIALSRAGKKVCLFDADTNLANINILLGITPLHTLEHFFKFNRDLKDVIIKGPEGMDIIAGASGIADFVQLSNSQRDKLINGIHALEENYDYLLIDTAAGIDSTNLNILLASPYLILSITHEPTSLTDAFSLLRVLRKHEFNRSVLVIVNMAASHQSAMNTFTRFKETVNKYLQFKVFFAGHILSDKNMPESILHQQAILLRKPDSPASRCLQQISERLLNTFDKRPPNRHSLSDNLTQVMFNEGVDRALKEVEYIPPPEVEIPEKQGTQTEPAQPEILFSKPISEKSALLQASYFARMVNQKR